MSVGCCHHANLHRCQSSRMIANRLLSRRLEEDQGLMPWLAVFTRAHSTTKLRRRLSQLINDVSRHQSSNWPLSPSFTIAKHDDLVWHTRPTWGVLRPGAAPHFNEWSVARFTNHTARVCINRTTCHSRTIKMGLHQGLVLSPLILMVIINSVSVEHHGVQPTGCMDNEMEPSRGVLRKHLHLKTNQFRPDPTLSSAPGRRCDWVLSV